MDNSQKKALKILSPKYVFENGILDEGQFFYEYEDEKGVANDGQAYDKPRAEGGKPVNALIYTVYSSGELESYYYLVNGFEVANSAEFYKNGQVSERDYRDSVNNTRYTFEWYENGVMKHLWKQNVEEVYVQEWFDENGNIIKKGIISGQLCFSYDFLNPDETVEVSWYENNRFKRIIWKEPDRERLYRAAAFDEEENITELVINNLYAPTSVLRDGDFRVKYAEKFGDNFKMKGEFLLQTDKNGEQKPFTGTLYDVYDNGTIKYVCNYKNGQTFGNQSYYYPDGKLAEFFDSSKGKISYQKYVWFKSGTLKSALIYLTYKMIYYYTEFDQSGNIIVQYHTDVPF